MLCAGFCLSVASTDRTSCHQTLLQSALLFLHDHALNQIINFYSFWIYSNKLIELNYNQWFWFSLLSIVPFARCVSELSMAFSLCYSFGFVFILLPFVTTALSLSSSSFLSMSLLLLLLRPICHCQFISREKEKRRKKKITRSYCSLVIQIVHSLFAHILSIWFRFCCCCFFFIRFAISKTKHFCVYIFMMMSRNFRVGKMKKQTKLSLSRSLRLSLFPSRSLVTRIYRNEVKIIYCIENVCTALLKNCLEIIILLI